MPIARAATLMPLLIFHATFSPFDACCRMLPLMPLMLLLRCA